MIDLVDKIRLAFGSVYLAGQIGANAVRGVQRQQRAMAAINAVVGTVDLERQIALRKLFARGMHVVDRESDVVDARASFAPDKGVARLKQCQRRTADAQKGNSRALRRAMRRP